MEDQKLEQMHRWNAMEDNEWRRIWQLNTGELEDTQKNNTHNKLEGG